MDQGSIEVIALIFTVTITWHFYTRLRCPSSLCKIPSVPFWKSLLATFKSIDSLERFDKLVVPVLNEKGIAKQFFFGRWMVMVSNPDYAKKILMKPDAFPKIQLNEELPHTLSAQLGKVNIASANGDEWKRHRRVANPAFHRSWSTSEFGKLVSKLIVEIENTHGPVSVTELMQRMTLDALGKIIFDYDFSAIENKGGDLVQTYNSVMTELNDPFYIMFPYLENLPLVGRRGYQTDLTRFDDFIMGIINSKVKNIRTNKTVDLQKADLVTLMVLSAEEGNQILTPEEIRNDVIVFFIAGQDTTSNALASTIYYLAVHPVIQQQAREEAIRVLGNEPQDVWPTYEQQQNELPFITAIMKESMRLTPSATQVLPRRCMKAVQFGEFVLPEGTPVNVDIYSMHHNPKNWDKPYSFLPERFLNEKTEHDLYAWMPFGGGSRRCLGMNFSLIEQRVVLSMLLRKYAWSLPEDSIHTDRLRTTPSSGLMEIRDLNVNFKALY
ncbi:cytochrome P450 [Basidiobolus meristosporus CBS 931.73]|uniref:Cytochrome P450 n=1 Tax=Basidiobolus meristosporus CBS 931.73 TaxID=1314790 RepID=A0A1Y1WWQ7_9FUNG|nr:cytochrome P450 [Basidiobolus meristosporus CBS 931.73]|eukprot:ORX77991.1 cytochrome P450 [Basidiobolus meristosporus CBS 931.73]